MLAVWILCVVIAPSILFAQQVPCPTGTEWWASDTSCHLCPIGFFRDGEAHEYCQACPVGHSTSREGAAGRVECSVTLGQPLQYQAGPDECARGYAPSATATDLCEACPVGRYKEEVGAQLCTPCPAGEQGVPVSTPSAGADSALQCLVDVTAVRLTPTRVYTAVGSLISLTVESAAPALRLDSVSTPQGPLCRLQQPLVQGGPVSCVTVEHPAPLEDPVTVYVQAGGLLRFFTSSELITVVPTPRINHIHRSQVFASGGVVLPMEFENLDSISLAQIIYYQPSANNTITQACTKGVTELRCPVPSLTQWLSRDAQAMEHIAAESSVAGPTGPASPLLVVEYGLVLDAGWADYSRLSTVLPDSGLLLVMADPRMWPLASYSSSDTVVISSEQPELTVMGERLSLGTRVDDYDIRVGGAACYVSMLSDVILTCRLQPHDLDLLAPDVMYEIRVTVGSLTFNPGNVMLEMPDIGEPTASRRPTSSTVAQSTPTPATHSTNSVPEQPTENPSMQSSNPPNTHHSTSTTIRSSSLGTNLAASSDNNSDENSTVVTIAAVCGVVVGLALVGVLLVFLLRHRRLQRNRDADKLSQAAIIVSEGHGSHNYPPSPSPAPTAPSAGSSLRSLPSLRGGAGLWGSRDGLSKSRDSTLKSVTSLKSGTLPPLPVQAIFGPNRRTAEQDYVMRPCALP